MRAKAVLKRAALSGATFVLLALVVEGVVRAKYALAPPLSVLDAERGWRMTANLTRQRTGLSTDGATYPIHFQTRRDGFKFWNEPPDRARRLLVIGDSYTAAQQVSNDKTYYAQLRERMGDHWSLFAYGMDGYGPLQESLVLEKFVPQVKPDLILWEWCINDFCNSSPYMDRRTVVNFNTLPRPFLEDGRIRMISPGGPAWLLAHSAAWRFISPRVAKCFLPKKPAAVDALDLSADWFKDAIRRTDETLARSRAKLGEVPIVAFSIDTPPEAESIFAALAEKHRIQFLPGLMTSVHSQMQTGAVLYADLKIGGHWNERGHAVVADFLYAALNASPRLTPP